MGLKSGQIIKMRNRLWRIDEYRETEIVATPINGDFEDRRIFLKDLEVITPAKMQPIDMEANGDFAAQQLLLRSYRFDLMHGSAPFLSLQRSAVVPYNYQLVPLILALEKPKARLLIADDVGLGKTIEAGLIMSELSQRGQAKRILILTPANLTEQWQQALDYFFHIDAKIISSFTQKVFEKTLPIGANPWRYFQVVIASFDYAKAPNIKHLIQEQSWDLVLFDEAHLCSRPHSEQHSKKQMQRYELMRDLGKQIDNVLLLTATPHNGYSDTFASLLEILNEDIVQYRDDRVIFDKKAARFNVCQRNRLKLEKWYKEQKQESPFPKRNQSEELVKPQGKYAELLQAVEQYTNSLLLPYEEVQFSRAKIMAYWTTLHLQKRAISSPHALEISLSNRLEAMKQKLETLEDVDIYEEAVVDLFSGIERLDEEAISAEMDKSNTENEETTKLEKLLNEVKKFSSKDDDKLQCLIKQTLPELKKENSKIIIFTKYKDTLEYLAHNLKKDNNVYTIHGGYSIKKRQDVFAEFDRQKSGLLIATDAISEGLNLQRLSSCIVHYELPWNPNRLEQRNGRIDRIGQEKDTVFIRTLILENTLDKEILNLLVEKTKTIKSDRGYSAAYFGDEKTIKELIKEADRKRRKKVKRVAENQLDLFAQQGTYLTEKAILKSFKGVDAPKRLKRIEAESFYDSLDIELPEIDKRIKETTEIVGSQKDVQAFVTSALKRFGSSIKERKDGFYDIFINDPRLELPKYGKQILKVTFDPKKGLQYPDATVLEVGHPIVRKLIENVKHAFFNDATAYGRTAYYISDKIQTVHYIYHILARFTVGMENKRVIEELITFGIDSFDENLVDFDTIRQINPAKTTENRTHNEVKEMVESAITLKVWEEHRDKQVNERKLKLRKERLALFKKIIADAASTEQHDWLDNMIHIEDAGTDLLAVTIVFPS